MERIKFSIKFSKEFELQRILWTKERFKWYTDNGYNLNYFVLPKGFSAKELSEKSDIEITKYINEEYNTEFFQPHIQTINSLLPGYLSKLADFFSKINIEVLPDIEIKLTKYGIGGSYSIPNVAIVNISKFFKIGLIRNILHETIHLHIQGLIDKYKIEQWEKEMIVDNIFEKFLPNLLKRQNYPKDMFNIQEIFQKNYPNLELIINYISKNTK
jgi:hypothetical protein